MDGCGPDDVGPEELKRNKTWREVRAELSRGVNPFKRFQEFVLGLPAGAGVRTLLARIVRCWG